MDQDEYTPVDYDEIIHETDEAVLFSIDDKEVWIPKSCIENHWLGELIEGIERQTVSARQVPVLEQFAIQKGLV